jgi:membrane protein YqaA with SNARE-associated domain
VTGEAGAAPAPNLLRRLYDRVVRAADGPRATRTLFGVSFAESSFFPVPPDVILLPMMLARRDRVWRLAGICTIASVLGGLLGYAIGHLLYDTVGRWIIDTYGLAEGAEAFHAGFAAWGFWLILAKGVTPIPYKLVTIASGLAGYDLGLFLLASIITRGARFYLLAVLVHFYGARVREIVERYLNWVALGFALLVIGGIAVVFLV